MWGWKHGDMFLAGQEIVFDFISDVGIRSIYLPLALVLSNANNQINDVLSRKQIQSTMFSPICSNSADFVL